MNMKIKTTTLQDMVAKAIKGASNNKMIPITGLIGINLTTDDIFELMTTDGSNHLKISQKIERPVGRVPGEFYTIVNADTFAKLVGKTTSENIELINNKNYLEIKGNGIYKMEIPNDEDGNIIQFPRFENLTSTESEKLSTAKLKSALVAAKVSVAKTMEVPCLTGYYLSKDLMTTDREMVCKIEDEFIKEPMLIPSEIAELIQLIDTDYVTLTRQDNKILFESSNITIYGKQLEGMDIYPVQPLNNLMSLEYEGLAKIKKADLLNVLDRMSLFVSDYDKNGVFLGFTPQGLQVRSQKSNATETIEIIPEENQEVKMFTCLIDIEMLKSQVAINSADVIKLYYGQEASIKIVDGNTTMIISLLSQDEN